MIKVRSITQRAASVLLSTAAFIAYTSICAAVPAAAGTLQAVEYYNAQLDHYFVTALASEISQLDAGVFAGWQRTHLEFTVVDPATPLAGTSPVCRFYGSPAAGLDSHFYSASPAECADVLRRFPGVWLLESDNAFGILLPDLQTGQCAAGSIPVYRSWNGRVDSNHRFTTDAAVQRSMIAQGYVAEGYGPAAMPVAMCSPSGSAQPGGAVPACVVSASNPAPYIGESIFVSAACTNGASVFQWTGCDSAGSSCSATSSVEGTVYYSVVARNAAGASVPAGISIAWQSTPPAPKCTVSTTSQTDPPVVSSIVVLKATCDQTVGTYSWSGCTSTSRICTARESSPGGRAYTVIASNAGGASAPATVGLNWVNSAPPAPGFCGQYPSYLISDVGAESVRVESVTYTNPPAFAWNGVWAVRFTVPTTAFPSRLGSVTAIEYAGDPTIREATISSTACDFRPTDASGASGPFARSSGTTTINRFSVSASNAGYPVLQPGGTYYYNVRNVRISDGAISCPSSPGRCDALVEVSIPH